MKTGFIERFMINSAKTSGLVWLYFNVKKIRKSEFYDVQLKYEAAMLERRAFL